MIDSFLEFEKKGKMWNSIPPSITYCEYCDPSPVVVLTEIFVFIEDVGDSARVPMGLSGTVAIGVAAVAPKPAYRSILPRKYSFHEQVQGQLTLPTLVTMSRA